MPCLPHEIASFQPVSAIVQCVMLTFAPQTMRPESPMCVKLLRVIVQSWSAWVETSIAVCGVSLTEESAIVTSETPGPSAADAQRMPFPVKSRFANVKSCEPGGSQTSLPPAAASTACPLPYEPNEIGFPGAPDVRGISAVSVKRAPAEKSTRSPGWSAAAFTRATVRQGASTVPGFASEPAGFT